MPLFRCFSRKAAASSRRSSSSRGISRISISRPAEVVRLMALGTMEVRLFTAPVRVLERERNMVMEP